MDAHTHLDNLAAARRALETGVTTIRSASVGSFRDVALRELVRAGYVVGPDVVAAGLYVTPDIGDGALADSGLGPLMAGVRSPDQLRALVRVNLRHGVDVIKTRGTERAGTGTTDPRQQVYTEEELRAVVDEAATRGIPVEAHAHGDEGAYEAVRREWRYVPVRQSLFLDGRPVSSRKGVSAQRFAITGRITIGGKWVIENSW